MWCADLILTLLVSVMVSTTVVQSTLSAALVFAMFIVWDDWCKFRLKQEKETDREQ